jgi:hypothetical protein
MRIGFWVVGLSTLALLSGTIVGSEMDVMLSADRMATARGAGKDPAKSMEEIQSYLLETLFLQPFSDSNQSVLTEEEEEGDMGSLSDKTMQTSMMNRTFAKQLAKQDLLGLKKHYIRPDVQSVVPRIDVPESVSAAPYLVGLLSD